MNAKIAKLTLVIMKKKNHTALQGYLVWSRVAAADGVVGWEVIVQSAVFPPDTLHARVEALLALIAKDDDDVDDDDDGDGDGDKNDTRGGGEDKHEKDEKKEKKECNPTLRAFIVSMDDETFARNRKAVVDKIEEKDKTMYAE
jgi:hypothetical protein